MKADLTSRQVREYIDSLVPDRVDELKTMEAYAAAEGFPIIGPASGHFLYLIGKMVGARSAFDMGAGYGYSTAWIARAVQENGGGRVYHVVWDDGLSMRARDHLTTLGYEDTVEYRVGEATDVLRDTAGPFDFIFSDMDKEHYPDALPIVAEKLRPGGVFVIDNMLWGGQIFDERDQSPATTGIREFTRLIAGDDGWITSLVPIRDGLIVACRR